MGSAGRAEPSYDQYDVEQEIAELERRLVEAKAKRAPQPVTCISFTTTAANHFLLLLSDSALPLGSFAFSSGLESYLAHHKAHLHSLPSCPPPSFSHFLSLSVSSYASTTLPFTLAAHDNPFPTKIAHLDDTLDATLICTVGRRASVAQGRALLSIWDRSLSAALPLAKGEALREFTAMLKKASTWSTSSSSSYGDSNTDSPTVSAHLAPLFGAVARLAGLSREQTGYVFLLGHVKALVSAAVRAGVFGPYQAQKVLAGEEARVLIGEALRKYWSVEVERAGQCVPVMDLWVGRHEVLYSRIFNS